MIIKRFFRSAFIIIVVCLFSHVAFTAATKVRIMEADNISFGTWAQSSVSGNDPVCVYRNDGVSTYNITATDDSTITPGGFYLENSMHTNQVAYAVTWGNTPSPGSTVLSDGSTAAASGANTASSTCAGGDSANFKIDITNSALAAVPPGVYTATITMVISQ